MANSIASMEKKLDKALQCIEEIECLKKKQIDLENKNRELEESLELFAHAKIVTLEKKLAEQSKVIGELGGGVKALSKQVKQEKQKRTVIFHSK